MLNLILLNLFFATVLLIFIILPVSSNWLWLGFIFTWCWYEGVIAQQKSVKWWHMLAMFLILAVAELYFISIFQFK